VAWAVGYLRGGFDAAFERSSFEVTVGAARAFEATASR